MPPTLEILLEAVNEEVMRPCGITETRFALTKQRMAFIR